MMVLQVGIPGERKNSQPADVPQSASGMDTVHENGKRFNLSVRAVQDGNLITIANSRSIQCEKKPVTVSESDQSQTKY